MSETPRERQVREWFELAALHSRIQAEEALRRGVAYTECEKSLGHVFALGSDVCVNCLCRVPDTGSHEFDA